VPSDKSARRFADIRNNIARIEQFTAGLDFVAFCQKEQAFYAVLHAC
jgi:uncharacterized protein with HEPN domain